MNSPWVNSQYRLPEEGQKIVVHYPDGSPWKDHVFVYSSEDAKSRKAFLYWMPFPELPEPDPFEEWHKQFTDDGSPTRKECRHSGWQAGVQWARSHPEK